MQVTFIKIPDQVKTIEREEAIARLRNTLVAFAADEHSTCAVAAEKGIFCKGFRQYSDQQLRQRYAWLVRHDPSATREQLEDIADRWQMARQTVWGLPCSCDVQRREHDTCGGWDDFTNQELSRFCLEVLRERVVVTS